MTNFQKVIFIAIVSFTISAVCVYGLLTPEKLVEIPTIPVSGIESVVYQGNGHNLEFALVNARSKVYRLESAFAADRYYAVLDNLDPWVELSDLESRGLKELYWDDYYVLFGEEFYDYEFTTRLRTILDPIADLKSY